MLTARNIQLLRQLKGISKKELSIMTFLSYSLISAIERGDRRLTEESRKRIESALKLDDEILRCITELQAGAGNI